jgi:anthranilate phosphoribosyltransferase
MSIAAPTQVVEVDGGQITTSTVVPEDVGLVTVPDHEATAGGDPEHNAQVTRAILAGEPGPRRDLALLNAGAAVYAAGRAGDLADGVRRATEAVDAGAARATLERLQALTGELAPR